jgi:hypothetical protein
MTIASLRRQLDALRSRLRLETAAERLLAACEGYSVGPPS